MDLLKVLAGKLAGIKCLSVPRGIDGERTRGCTECVHNAKIHTSSLIAKRGISKHAVM